MSYLGNNPNKGSFFQQKLAGDGSTTSFTLLQSVTDGSQLLVTIGNVIQEEGNGKAYTASGATLTFDSAPANGDVIVVRYLGRSLDTPTTYATQITFKYVATNGQTAFTGSDANGITLSYTIGSVDVYLNGVHLDTTDFTETNESTITLASGATTSDEVVIVAKRTITLTDVVPKSAGGTFAGNVIAGGNLTVNGAFTSQGIDDNADATAITIDSSENVGISETSPLAKLHVKTADSGGSVNASADELVIEGSANSGITLLSGASNNGNIFFGDSGDDNAGRIAYAHSNNSFTFTTNGSNALTIDSSGNLGLGTSSPAFAVGGGLQVKGSSFTSVRVTSGGNTGIDFSQTTSGVSYLYNRDNADLIIGTNDTERMRINSSGNVGIGTASPSSKFVIYDSSNPYIYLQNSTTGTGVNDGFSIVEYGTDAYINNRESGNMLFYNSNTERMRIDSSGRVGIGISSPTADGLHIFHATQPDFFMGNNTDADRFVITSNDTDTLIGNRQATALRFKTDDTERMRIAGGGPLLINRTTGNATASTAVDIDANQHIYCIVMTANPTNGAFVRFLKDNGDTIGSIDHTSTATRYLTSSDYRLKENVTYDFDATSRFKQLKPCRFNFKVDADTTVDGFIAHEVTVVPEAISGEKDATNEDGSINPQGIDQSKLVPLLTKTLQEALLRIDTLEAEVKALKG